MFEVCSESKVGQRVNLYENATFRRREFSGANPSNLQAQGNKVQIVIDVLMYTVKV